MTMHIAEHETPKIVQDEVDPSEVAYLPLTSIVEVYRSKTDALRGELDEVNAKIGEVELQLHQHHLKQLYREEVMMSFAPEVGESSIEIILSEEARSHIQSLTEMRDALIEKRNLLEASIEEARISRIRHEEAIEHRLFTSATNSYY
jgi:hypothetical protein